MPADRGRRSRRSPAWSKEHAEELAELETLDNGKPLARNVDVASTAAHLRYFAGWPTKIEGDVSPVSSPTMLAYTRREPVGVCAPDHPVELPAADGGVEARPGAGRGLHGRAQARRADAADRAAAGRAGAGGRHPGRACSTCSPATARPARRWSSHPGVDKIAFTGSTAVGPRDRRQGRPRAEARHARARRQVAQHHPARRRPRGRGQGLLPGDLLQLRPGLQRRLAPVRAGRPVRRGGLRAGRAGSRARPGPASTPTPSSARSSRPSSTSACPTSSSVAARREPS